MPKYEVEIEGTWKVAVTAENSNEAEKEVRKEIARLLKLYEPFALESSPPHIEFVYFDLGNRVVKRLL